MHTRRVSLYDYHDELGQHLCFGGAFALNAQHTVSLNDIRRFGFSPASGIDALLDKDDVSLEAILDEDELLQECKSQNTRLMEYFQRPDVLQRLLGYVTGEVDGDERGKFKCVVVASFALHFPNVWKGILMLPRRCYAAKSGR